MCLAAFSACPPHFSKFAQEMCGKAFRVLTMMVTRLPVAVTSWDPDTPFLSQGPEGFQLAHDRQGLREDRWVRVLALR